MTKITETGDLYLRAMPMKAAIPDESVSAVFEAVANHNDAYAVSTPSGGTFFIFFAPFHAIQAVTRTRTASTVEAPSDTNCGGES